MSEEPKLSRQVRRHTLRLAKKAEDYDRSVMRALRYEPVVNRGKKYPWSSKKQQGRANLEALNHAIAGVVELKGEFIPDET